MMDSHLWRQKIERYRKWERRLANASAQCVSADTRREYGRQVGHFYLDLTKDARNIVTEYGKDVRTRFIDTIDFPGDERLTKATATGGHSYTLKTKNDDPDRLWFQRFAGEPWFDLGYYNQKLECWTDTKPPTKTFAQIVAENRALDFARAGNHPSRFDHIAYGKAIDMHTDHVHMATVMTDPSVFAKQVNELKGIDPMLSSTNPDELEAAAAHAMATAAKIRAFAALEPQDDDEPTISWKWTPDPDAEQTYTYVAFKADNGRWYTTGSPRYGAMNHGHTWRDLGDQRWAEPLTNGDFLIVTGWAKATDDE